MERLHFSVDINASKEKVWDTLWAKGKYEAWTAVFSEGSTVETDWKEGSKVLFTDGKGSGMVSKISANKPNEYMSFTHLGEMKDGVEDTTSEKVKQWQGCTESYTLTESNGGTKLEVDMDITADFKDYFENTWPKAIETIKTLAEAKN